VMRQHNCKCGDAAA